MGMDLRVTYSGVEPPPWAAVAATLSSRGWAVTMRMIDNELAFPEEMPPDGWRELRVAADGSMVTIRKGGSDITLVTWGNADTAGRRWWQRLAWAFAATGDGRIVSEAGTQTAAEFAASRPLEE